MPSALVVLFERNSDTGGQFNSARRILGKEEFAETLRYYRAMLEKHGVEVRLNTEADVQLLRNFDAVILASDVRPRELDLPGSDHPRVIGYPAAILHPERIGRRVAIIGAGGIGFDVAEVLTHVGHPSLDPAAWRDEWGVDINVATRGGLKLPKRPQTPRLAVRRRPLSWMSSVPSIRVRVWPPGCSWHPSLLRTTMDP